jgi:hypothetical protein
MSILLSMTIALVAGLQEMTSERSGDVSDTRVVVAFADEDTTSAVDWVVDRPDGIRLAWVYTVHRIGTPETNWTTPAYNLDAVDFDCEGRGIRLSMSRLYRTNGDPLVRDYRREGTFEDIDGDPRKVALWSAACTHDVRPVYRDWFHFMEAYGLYDGREPRVPPGPRFS